MDKEKSLPDFQARRTISDLEYVYGELKQAFMMGEFEPGQRLPLPFLAEAFGTSQMPIREAMSRLVVARAMEALPRKSLRVPEATSQRLDELLPLRLLLEGEATRLAVLAGNPSLPDELDEINHGMDTLVDAGDRKGYLRLNQQFHFTVYRDCANADLIDLIELLWMRYGPLMNVVRSQVLSNTGHAHHHAVVSWIREGNVERAVGAIRTDIADAATSIRGVITQLSEEKIPTLGPLASRNS